MSQELAGKVAIVTGGVGGLGSAMVDLFVEEGGKVVVADLNEAGKDLANKAAIRFRKTDVTDEADVKALVDYAVGEFGGLHVMVNNAAIASNTPANFLDIDVADFDRVMRINVLGVILGTKWAGRHMSTHGGGSIINMSSSAGVFGGGGPMVYRASKAGVVQITQSMALELARFKIRVNAIAPYNIKTKIMATSLGAKGQKLTSEQFKRIDDVYRETMMQVQPLKRQAIGRDIANAAMFYASDRSLQVTGTILPVDGGYTAGDSVDHAPRMVAAREKVLAEL